MYGAFLVGESPPGVSPNVVGEALFFNSEVLRCNSRFMSLLRLNSGFTNQILINSPIESSTLKLISEIHQTEL